MGGEGEGGKVWRGGGREGRGRRRRREGVSEGEKRIWAGDRGEGAREGRVTHLE